MAKLCDNTYNNNSVFYELFFKSAFSLGDYKTFLPLIHSDSFKRTWYLWAFLKKKIETQTRIIICLIQQLTTMKTLKYVHPLWKYNKTHKGKTIRHIKAYIPNNNEMSPKPLQHVYGELCINNYLTSIYSWILMDFTTPNIHSICIRYDHHKIIMFKSKIISKKFRYDTGIIEWAK